MAGDRWLYTHEICDGHECISDCDRCGYREEIFEAEEDSADYISRQAEQTDRGYIEQIKWERDLAIRQLADFGYSLGEKPRTNGDLISRQAVIDKINERQRKLIYCFGFENDAVKIMDIAKSIIIAIPPAQPDTIEMEADDFCSRAERRTDDEC